jgi:glycine betaine/choline ABC-type transport system substrate-binding protein
MADLLCYNNSNSKDMIRQAIDKSLGLVKGRNDLSLYYRGRALLLELKAKDGKQSDAQKQFEQTHTTYDNHYRVAYSFDEATDIIRKFITWCDK